MSIKSVLLYWFAFWIILYGFNPAPPPIDGILSKIKKYNSDFPQEKIHLHLDKASYAAGDTVWFKAYVVDAVENRLFNLSKILYVDLVDENDRIRQTFKLPLDAGLGWGNITIADTVKEGNYRIRAYTNWMRNFSTNFFFERLIAVGSLTSDQINSTISYNELNKDGQQQLVATINYQNNEGNPVVGKPVTCEIILSSSKLIRRKALTDASGRVIVSFPLFDSQAFPHFLNASLKIDNKRIITKKCPINLISKGIDVQFFPEGGHLVDGIRSQIAFKATGADGKGVNITGIVMSESQPKVAEFTAEHAGMGVFLLTPQKGEHYQALIKLPDGSQKSFPLPVSMESGYCLAVDNSDSDKLKINIRVSPMQANEGELSVVAQMNGVVSYASRSPVNANQLSAEISKDRFPTGMLHVTLFSPHNIPLAERLVFINHHDQMNVSMQIDKPVYEKRGKTNVSLIAKDVLGKPITGSFSVAVIDEATAVQDELNEKSILSDLLLTSDLKGYIEAPNYYFTSYTKKKSRQLDILMMTQGWCRFIWQDVLAGKDSPVAYLPEKSLEIIGKVTRGYGQKLADAKVGLYLLPKNELLKDTATTTEGKFSFTNLFFTDTAKFLLLATDKKGYNSVNLEVTKPAFALQSSGSRFYSEMIPNVNESMQFYLQNRKEHLAELERQGLFKRSILLKEVNIKGKKLSKVEEALQASDNLNGAGNADKVITYLDLQNYHNLSSYLQGKIAGVVITGRNGQQMAYSRGYGAPMLIVLDGVVTPVSLDAIDVYSIQSIEVLKSAGYLSAYGMRGAGGVLVITTKRGGIDYDSGASTNRSLGFLYYNMAGYHLTKEFYSPVYERTQNKTVKDLRTTLFWNPNIATDHEGKASFHFYNADGAGKKRIIIEGISADGKLGRSVTTYSVN